MLCQALEKLTKYFQYIYIYISYPFPLEKGMTLHLDQLTSIYPFTKIKVCLKLAQWFLNWGGDLKKLTILLLHCISKSRKVYPYIKTNLNNLCDGMLCSKFASYWPSDSREVVYRQTDDKTTVTISRKAFNISLYNNLRHINLYIL